MNERTNIYSNLSDQTKFRLKEINKIEDYFNTEIQERKTMSKKLIAPFDSLLLLVILTRLELFNLQQVEEFLLFLLQVLLMLL